MANEHGNSRGEAKQSFFAKQELINSAKAAFQLLSAVMRNATIYPDAHPFLLASAEKLLSKIEELLVSRKEVAFYLVGGELFFEKISIPIDESLVLVMEQFASRDLGGISFKPGLSQTELIKFAGLVNKETSFFTAEGGLNEAIAKEDIVHVELHRVLLVNKKPKDTAREGEKRTAEIFMNAVSTVKELVRAVHLEKAINVRKMNTTVQTMVDSILDNRDAFMGLTSIKMFDEYTFAHSVNTAVLAISLGTFLSFDKAQVAALGMAGLLHDIGKVSVPLDIVNKPGKLTDEEWKMMMRHPIEGALLLSDVSGMTKLAMVTAFEHHQHGKVRGYPNIDGRHQQHLFAQIVSLVDAYDAITASRVYHSMQTPPDQAIRTLINQRGSTFDPLLVKTFVNMIGLFPAGTVLKLDTGEIGLVMHQTRDLLRPRVLLLDKFDGSEKEAGEEVSLLETAGGRYKRSIAGTINPYTAKIDVKKYLTE
jgi:HD-GYP domain-containing protein (c-di-GMP phosphodiesterase class II)